VRYRFYKRRSLFKTRTFHIGCLLFVVLAISITSVCFTHRDFAIELRQVKQPKPSVFYIGIDVSQTVRPDTLAEFKDALVLRLRDFIGEKRVFYHVSIFGLPGCGKEAIADIVSTQSPEDPVTFSRRVERRIREISIARRLEGGQDEAPLTTPLFCFLEKTLTERIGARVIVFSDLVNDDGSCQKQYSFPLKAITKFGRHKEGQIIFLYLTPYAAGKYDTPDIRERLIKKQRDFVMEMQKLSSKGKVRAYFYHIPSYHEKRLDFLRSQLRNSIPATIVEIIRDRISRMIDIFIGPVRG